MSKLEFNSSVSKVTVYTDRAMIARKVKANLPKNTKSVQILGLPTNLKEDSLRIGGNGPDGMTILDFKTSLQSYRDVPVAALNTLEEERTRFKDNIQALKDEIATLDHQKDFLKQISVGKSKQFSTEMNMQRPVLDDWKSVLEFLGNEQLEIDENRREKQLKIRKIEEDIRMIEAELEKHAGAVSKSRKVVTIELELEQDGDYEFELSYLNYEASWHPMYDARVDSKNKKVGIRYYGLVTQTTGEDWAGIEILLSTARPQLGGNAPELRAWKVSPYIALAREESYGGGGGLDDDGIGFADQEMMVAAPRSRAAAAPLKKKAKMEQATVEPGQGTSVVFRTGGRGFVPGDGSPGKLLIMDSEFGNRFSYLTVPKLAEHVYLRAEITNTTDFPLLPGKISIFLEGNFIGQSKLKELITPAEKFDLELGVDESIKVKHKLQKQKGDEKGLFSRSKVQAYSYLITLDSQRETAEEIIVRDQLPVSLDEKIKVEVTKLFPAENPEKDKDKLPNGTVEWKLMLEPKATQKLDLSFTVSYPKDMDVTGL